MAVSAFIVAPWLFSDVECKLQITPSQSFEGGVADGRADKSNTAKQVLRAGLVFSHICFGKGLTTRPIPKLHIHLLQLHIRQRKF